MRPLTTRTRGLLPRGAEWVTPGPAAAAHREEEERGGRGRRREGAAAGGHGVALERASSDGRAGEEVVTVDLR
jgi:hypothetical protein